MLLHNDLAGQQPYESTSESASLTAFAKQLEPLQQSLPHRFLRLHRFFRFFFPTASKVGKIDREMATIPTMSERRGAAVSANDRARESRREASKSHLVPALPVSFGGQPTASVECTQRVR
jgi:hypothetical protein